MSSEIPALLALLKRVFRQKAISYRDASAQLGVSEPTVKRYFAGRSLTIERLEKLCSVGGIRLSDLHRMLADEALPASGRLSLTQELGLTRNFVAAFILYLLRSGWRSADIATELGLSDDVLFRHLRTLERLALIDILSHNSVRLRVGTIPDWLPDGPIRRAIDVSLRSLFDRVGHPSPTTLWELDTIKISRTHVPRLAAAIERFTQEVRALGEHAPGGEHVQWYSVLCTARPVDLSIILRGQPEEAG